MIKITKDLKINIFNTINLPYLLLYFILFNFFYILIMFKVNIINCENKVITEIYLFILFMINKNIITNNIDIFKNLNFNQ